MGIQSLRCVVLDGEYKVAIRNTNDGVPEGMGLKVLKAIRESNYDDYVTRFSSITPTEEDAADLKFAANSLLCEWAYVVDLDRNTFEVFQGFNRDQLDDSERFKFLDGITVDSEYKAVKLAARFPLDNLPSDKQFEAFFKEE